MGHSSKHDTSLRAQVSVNFRLSMTAPMSDLAVRELAHQEPANWRTQETAMTTVYVLTGGQQATALLAMRLL